MRRSLINYTFLLLFVSSLSGCISAPSADEAAIAEKRRAEEAQAAAAAAPAPAEVARYSGPIQFADVTEQAGINFKHNSGAAGKKYLPETMGAGCAFLDFDNDGWQDILLVNSMSWPEQRGQKSYPALYRNNRNGSFTDVTRDAGLAVEMYGLGCAIADYDNDGNVDIYFTCLGRNLLFRNLGGGRFADVSLKSRVDDPGFSASAAWVDYDKDGKLDLFVCNYVEWSVATDVFCSLDGKNKSYCTPERYKGQSPSLYRNRGDGTFENVTERAGLKDPTAKAMGVALIDYDDDGWIDLFVANDTQPNRLYKNNGNGTFKDVAMEAGVAFSDSGKARAGMGTDAADFDGSGRAGLVVGNFTNEMMALYRNEGGGLFIDEAQSSSIGKASAQSLTFATFFFDYDLDGLLDIFAANGHVSDDIGTVQPKTRHAMPPHLFRNLGKSKFAEVTSKMGAALAQPVVGRGAAYGDFDNDGDLDLLATANNGPARLFRNDGGNQNNVIRVKTVGSRSNRDGIGAKITAKTSGQWQGWGLVKTGSSYCSQSELTVTFGLGKSDRVASVEVLWPSGHKDVITDTAANQTITIQEGKGVISAQPIILGLP